MYKSFPLAGVQYICRNSSERLAHELDVHLLRDTRHVDLLPSTVNLELWRHVLLSCSARFPLCFFSQSASGVWSKGSFSSPHTEGAKYALWCDFFSYSSNMFHVLDILMFLYLLNFNKRPIFYSFGIYFSLLFCCIWSSSWCSALPPHSTVLGSS